MDYFTLTTGRKMPMDGIGTYLLSPKDAYNAVKSALNDGIRLIDTANAYENEKAVGRAIHDSGVNREDIFLVSKLWPSVYDDPNAVENTLKRLDTDYVDLLFLHQPTSNWRNGYKQLEKAYKEGKIRAIGLSNFPLNLLEEIEATAEVKPHMVQVEAHPYDPRPELTPFLKEHGMGLMSWYPLGHGDSTLINQPIFTKLAQKYHKMNAQIILRWHTQMGFVVIPGSKNPQHIRDNFNIFDFKLTDEEMAEIAKLDNGELYYHQSDAVVEEYRNWHPDFDKDE